MPNFPVVFLPGPIGPSNDGGTPLRQLSYPQLQALRKASGGGGINARTPDPQARRLEFKYALLVEQDRFDAGRPLNDFPTLAQFYALVEGIIYGNVRLQIFDLRGFNFPVPNDQRYLGVILNRQGRTLGGTDPDTLFFSASSALPADFAELEGLNTEARNANKGVVARQMLRGFRQLLQPAWQPIPLWMRLLDLLFFAGNPAGGDNLSALTNNWKQVGPITLRVNLAAGHVNYRQLYLPTYEENYRHKVLTALSGDMSQANDSLQLNVKGLPAGKILAPNSLAGGGQDPVSLGAGTIETESVSQQVPIHVNYANLKQHIQGIINQSVDDHPQIARRIAVESPFAYPDVIRIPVLHDGFVAVEEFRPRLGTSFSERFKARMRGKGVYEPPSMPEGTPHQPMVQNGSDCYYIDGAGGLSAVYIESYKNERIDELTTLGYVLWSIFDKQAAVSNQNYVHIGGVEVLRYTGIRYELNTTLQPNWPDFAAKAASLQRLIGALGRGEAGPLFKAAVTQWMSKGYSQQISAQPSNPTHILVGDYTWYIDSY